MVLPEDETSASCGLGSLPAAPICVTLPARHTRGCRQIMTPRPQLRLDESTCTAIQMLSYPWTVFHMLWQHALATVSLQRPAKLPVPIDLLFKKKRNLQVGSTYETLLPRFLIKGNSCHTTSKDIYKIFINLVATCGEIDL